MVWVWEQTRLVPIQHARTHTHTHTRTRLNQFVNKKLLTFAHYTFDMLFVLFWGLMGLYVLVHVWCLSVLCLYVLVHA